MGRFLAALMLLAIFWSPVLSDEKCKKVNGDPCRCSTNTTTIDLRNIFPSFPQYVTTSEHKFLYSPCKPVVPNSTVGEGPALVWQLLEKQNIALGRNAIAIVNTTDPLHFKITYNDGDDGSSQNKKRKAVFYYMQTNETTTINFLGTTSQIYDINFQVTGRTVTPVTSRRPSSGGIANN